MVDGGAMFGVVPKVLWNKKYPANDDNLINLSLRSLIVDNGKQVILIDSGYGDKQSEKFFKHTYINGGDGLIGGIRNAGYKPEDITDIVLTHLHADHCGGAVKRKDSLQGFELTFPDANTALSTEGYPVIIIIGRSGYFFFTILRRSIPPISGIRTPRISNAILLEFNNGMTLWGSVEYRHLKPDDSRSSDKDLHIPISSSIINIVLFISSYYYGKFISARSEKEMELEIYNVYFPIPDRAGFVQKIAQILQWHPSSE